MITVVEYLCNYKILFLFTILNIHHARMFRDDIWLAKAINKV